MHPKSKRLRLESNNFSNQKSRWPLKRTPTQSHLKRLTAPCGQPPLCDCLPSLFCKDAIFSLMIWGPLQRILFARICFHVFVCSISLPTLFGPYLFGGLVPDKIRRVNNTISCFCDFFFSSGKQLLQLRTPKPSQDPELRKHATLEGTINKGGATLQAHAGWAGPRI